MHDICLTLVTTNEAKTVRTCLLSFFEDIKESALDIAVVIVDNASNDDVAELLRKEFPRVQCIRQEKNVGFGASHNRAIAAVSARYYFVLNPDTTFPKEQHLLDRMFAFMESHPQVGMLGPRIHYPDGSLQYSCFRFPSFLQPLYSRTKLGTKGKGKRMADYFLMKDTDHEQTMPVDWVMGSAMFVRKDAIDAVGVFDERYWMYAEDSDWCRRMWEAGWPVYYLADVWIEHVHGRASAKVPGVVAALIKNKYARVHVISWLKYFWKWRGNKKYYGHGKTIS